MHAEFITEEVLEVMAAAVVVAAGAVAPAAVFPGSFRSFVFWRFGLAIGLVGASSATTAVEAIAAAEMLGLGLGEVAGLGVSAGL